jgi:hypothetical protein
MVALVLHVSMIIVAFVLHVSIKSQRENLNLKSCLSKSKSITDEKNIENAKTDN